MDSPHPIDKLEIASLYESYPPPARSTLLQLRDIIYQLSDTRPEIGQIEECLKWGEISYVPHHPKSGTTVRFSYRPTSKQCAILVHCSTTLIDNFKNQYPDAFEYEKNRAILFPSNEDVDIRLLTAFLENALSYHLKPKIIYA